MAARGLSSRVADVMEAGWRPRTMQGYNCYVRKWEDFCGAWGWNPIHAPAAHGLEFLAELLDDDTERGYRTLCTARSALSTVVSSLGGAHSGQTPTWLCS